MRRIIRYMMVFIACIFMASSLSHAGEREIKDLRDKITLNEKKLKQAKAESEALSADIEAMAEELTEKNTELDRLEEEITERHEETKRRIKYLYENGDASLLPAFLSSRYSSALNRRGMSFDIHLYDRMKLDEYEALITEAEGREAELQAGIEELEGMRTRQDELASQIQGMVRKDKKRLEKEIEAKEEAEANAAEGAAPTGRFGPEGNTYIYGEEDLHLIYAIVMQECNISYEGALAVITCACNRAESPRWRYLGKDPLSQLTAEGQFCYSLDNYWRKYLGNNVSQEIRDAVDDALNGKRSHSFLSFRGYVVKGGVNIGDNYYFNKM